MIICSPQLGISPTSSLGGEVYDREVIRRLDTLGVKTLIILPKGKSYPPLKHAKVYFLPISFVYPPWLFNLFILPYLFYLYSKYKFTILRVHSPYFVGLGAWLFTLFTPAVKVIPSYLHIEGENWLYKKVDSFLLPRYHQITTISEATKRDIVYLFNVSPRKIKVIPCGIDKKYQPKAKNKQLVIRLGLEGKKTLLYLGQLIPRKNVEFLFSVLKDLPSNFHLVIAGDGPDRVRLEQQVKKENLSSRTIFTGFVPEAEKVDFYNLADTFVYPSLNEGFGLSVAEAAACGKRVICSNLSVFKEINSRAIVQVPLSVPKWVKAIQSARKSKKHKIAFTWEKTGDTLYELYQQ